MIDAWRLALGTLTILPVRPPSLRKGTAPGRAMTLAPVVGLLLGGIAAGVGWLADRAGLGSLVVATLVLGSLALLTRGLHLDGLADTADALGSRLPSAGALDVMKRSDIGPFGVLSVVFILLIQVSSLAELWSRGLGASAIVAATITGRCAVTVACRRGVPAARAGGLGAMVAGTVRRVSAVAAAIVTAALSAVLVDLDGGAAWRGALAVGLALAAALLFERHVVRRLGGITGDVLGALVEISTAACLLVLAT